MAYAATIGFFDGVHRGHQFVLKELRHLADRTGLQSAVITFNEHPQLVLSGNSLPLLTTYHERIERLREEQVNEIFAFNFEVISSMTARDFLQILHTQCEVEMLLMGYDHRFGSDQLSRFEDYQAIADSIGMQMIQLPQVRLGHTEETTALSTTSFVPSSTKIRKCLQAGLVEEANELLGYRYALSGEIVEGRHLGRTIGFPTANIAVAEEKLRPAVGVYAGRLTDTELGFNDYPVLVNIGSNPTVGGRAITVEMHIPHWEGDLYGRQLTVELVHYLRSEKKFPSLEALKQQIHRDMQMLQ